MTFGGTCCKFARRHIIQFSGFVNKARYSIYGIKRCPHCFSWKLFMGNLWVISFSSPESLGLICDEPVQPRFKTTWPGNYGLWGRKWSCLHRREKEKKCLSFVVQRPFCMLEKVVRLHARGITCQCWRREGDAGGGRGISNSVQSPRRFRLFTIKVGVFIPSTGNRTPIMYSPKRAYCCSHFAYDKPP